MNAKQWITKFFLLFFFFLTLVGAINYVVDPLWTFGHSNQFNKFQEGFNERQQKSNAVYFNKLKQFNGILLGSSRTTFINQYDFEGMKIYNYASNSMYPFEYKGYINFAKKNGLDNLKYIIIGLDFYGSGIANMKKLNIHYPSYYFNKSTSLFYRYKMMFLKDTLVKSFINIQYSLSEYKKHTFSRNNIKYNSRVSEEERKKAFKEGLKRHLEAMSTKKYHYDNNYINRLKEIKKENPKSQFIIFTSPITAALLTSLLDSQEKLKAYRRWLKETIDVFGEVHHFMTINSITLNLNNYCDDDHFYPYIGTLIAHKLSGKKDPNIPKDFGILLTKNNIDTFLEKFENDVKYYSHQKLKN